jgi:hypothetical protein
MQAAVSTASNNITDAGRRAIDESQPLTTAAAVGKKYLNADQTFDGVKMASDPLHIGLRPRRISR